jgi:hypothetical protein
MTVKVTLMMSLGKASWSEAHFLAGADSFSAAQSNAVALANARAGMLGGDATIDAVRLSLFAVPRYVEYLDGSLFSDSGSWSGDTEEYTGNHPNLALLCRASSSGDQKNLYLAGFPEAIAQQGTTFKGGYIPNSQFITRFAAFKAALLNGFSFPARLFTGSQRCSGPLVQNAQFPGMVGVPTAAAVGLAVGDQAYVYGFRRINTKIGHINGLWQVRGILAGAAPGSVIYFLANTSGVDPNNFFVLGNIVANQHTFENYSDLVAKKVVSRKRGATLGAPRGRSRTRR